MQGCHESPHGRQIHSRRTQSRKREGNAKSEGVCYHYQKGTCTTRNTASAPTSKKRAALTRLERPRAEPNSPCKFFALGTCKFGDSCKDRHGSPGNGKSTGKGKGICKKGTSASPVAADAAIIVCESVTDRRHTYRAPVGVALAASVNFENADRRCEASNRPQHGERLDYERQGSAAADRWAW